MGKLFALLILLSVNLYISGCDGSNVKNSDNSSNIDNNINADSSLVDDSSQTTPVNPDEEVIVDTPKEDELVNGGENLPEVPVEDNNSSSQNTPVIPDENDNENVPVIPNTPNIEVVEISKTASGVLFSKGVDKDKGWTDVDKSSLYGYESNACWISASSNMISWWQKQHSIYYPNSDVSYIYRVILHHFGSQQGNMEKGLRWYFIGDDDLITGGYLRNYVKNPMKEWSYWPSLRTAYNYIDNIYSNEFFDVVTKELQKGVVALALSRFDDGSTQHAVTLWGVEYSNGKITKVYLADSDDLKHQLAEYKVYEENNRITLNGYKYFQFIKSVTILYP